MGEEVAERDHQPAVGVASQNAQTAQRAPRLGVEAREDAIAAQEEVLAEEGRQERGPQALGLHQGDGEEAVIATKVQAQSWRKQGAQGLGGHGVSQDQASPSNRLQA